jgi:uncharacterized lipoprotein YmbA
MTNLRMILSCACILQLAGCANAPIEHFYTLLGSPPIGSSVDGAARHAPGIMVASVTLPETVDRAELVVRSGPNRMTVMENRRWAESLKSAIPRAIARDLSQLLEGAPVSVRSDKAIGDAEYLVSIDITRFDSVLNEAASIEAFWSVRPAAGRASEFGKSAIRVPAHGAGFDELAAAHAQALADLSSEIAARIKAMEAAGK